MTMEAQTPCFDPALVALLWEIKGVQKSLNPHSPDDAIICSVDAAIQLT
jgi:hypothetical protein